MFSEKVFIADCNAFLRSKSYEDYEDVRPDIELFVKSNLSPDLMSLDLIRTLCGKILAEYINYDYENSPPVEPETDTDDILYQSVEIWLAAAGGNSGSV